LYAADFTYHIHGEEASIFHLEYLVVYTVFGQFVYIEWSVIVQRGHSLANQCLSHHKHDSETYH